jgi:hypothetical protein
MAHIPHVHKRVELSTFSGKALEVEVAQFLEELGFNQSFFHASINF